MGKWKQKFGQDDVAQQLLGGFLIGGPFIVTEEVWSIASAMSSINVIMTFLLVSILGYGILYVAVVRDPDKEETVGGFIPIRFISLMVISYGSGMTVALAIGAPTHFIDSTSLLDLAWNTVKAATTISIFTVIGAGTVDSAFRPDD